MEIVLFQLSRTENSGYAQVSESFSVSENPFCRVIALSKKNVVYFRWFILITKTPQDKIIRLL